MSEAAAPDEPDWDVPLNLRVTPNGLIHALFWTASAVHSGWSSCIESTLVIGETLAADETTGNWCRLVEQEFVEDGQEDMVWRDWSVELRIGDVYVIGHWQLPVSASPMEWDWQTREAEQAFEKACVLLGKRVRKGLVVEDPNPQAAPPNVRRH
jgi:hypothetical protein